MYKSQNPSLWVAPPGITKPLWLLAITCATLILCSCSWQSEKSDKTHTDSLSYALPKPGPITDAERASLQNAVQAWYDTLIDKSGFEGGILVAKGGNIVYERYRGYTDQRGTDSITSNTAFHIASVTKTFTAMAVLKLLQDGRLALDDPFSKFFPGFPYPGVTIKNLLNHRSGLPNYVYAMEDLGWDKEKMIRNQDVLDFLINRKNEIKNIARPDTRFSYCNTNYALLALLIEKVSGKPFPVFMQEQYFKPLGMYNSFVYTKNDSARAPLSFDWRRNAIPMNFLDEVYGDKNMYSTPRDLLIWDRALKEGVIFSKETLQLAYSPYSNEKPGIRNYGLGWRLNVYPDGNKLVYHNGWWHGNNASFIRMIPEDATIIVVGNRFTRAVYKSKYLCSLFNLKLTDREEEGDSSKSGGSPR